MRLVRIVMPYKHVEETRYPCEECGEMDKCTDECRCDSCHVGLLGNWSARTKGWIIITLVACTCLCLVLFR